MKVLRVRIDHISPLDTASNRVLYSVLRFSVITWQYEELSFLYFNPPKFVIYV